MAFPRLKEFAEMKGWKIEKNTAYGEQEGYLFTLVDAAGSKTFATPLPQIDDLNKNSILEFLGENKKALGIGSYSFSNQVLIVKFQEDYKSTKLEVMNNLVNQLTEYLKSLDIKGKGCCIFCGKEGAEQTVNIDKIMYNAHEECYNDEMNRVEQAAREYEMEDKNYLKGSFGAILGGIIASVPWIVIQTFLDRVAAVAAIIIGMGALKGYYLLKGKLGPMTRWIVAFSTVLSVVVAQFISLGIEMVMNEIPLSIQNFVLVLGIPEVLSTFEGNLVISLIIAFVGIIGLFRNLKGDSKSVMPTMTKE